MPPGVAAPPASAPAWLWGLFYVVLLVVAGLVFWRSVAKPKGEAKAATSEATIIAGAFGSPNDMRIVLEELKRIGAFVEVSNKLADDALDATRDVERAVRDHCASDERAAARAADALIRSADETRRLGDTMAQVISAMSREK
jgi:hypothetical protein